MPTEPIADRPPLTAPLRQYVMWGPYGIERYFSLREACASAEHLARTTGRLCEVFAWANSVRIAPGTSFDVSPPSEWANPLPLDVECDDEQTSERPGESAETLHVRADRAD